MVAAASNPTVHLTLQTRLLAAVIGIVFIMAILELIRRHKLQERYTALWLIVGCGFVACAVFPQLLTLAADILGVRDTNVALFALLIGGLVLVVLHLTVVISQQSEQITRLAQEQAITAAHGQLVPPPVQGGHASRSEAASAPDEALPISRAD